jgi:hypothetical protein
MTYFGVFKPEFDGFLRFSQAFHPESHPKGGWRLLAVWAEKNDHTLV